MNKKNAIFTHFDHRNELTVSNKNYQNSIIELFQWLLHNDKVKDDITTRLTVGNIKDEITTARMVAKKDTIISGIEEIIFLLTHFSHLKVIPILKDGNTVKKGEDVLTIQGSFSEILLYERSILNIMQRMSGIASETARYVSAINDFTAGYSPYILATRKTPLMVFDKKAVVVGGGLTHRMNLSDGILVKDNHLLALKKEFDLKTEQEYVNKAIKILFQEKKEEFAEIEIEEDESVLSAVKTFTDLNIKSIFGILLDNFTPERAKKIISQVHEKYNLKSVLFEASGGVTFNNIKEWSASGVDVISVGALTHSVTAADLSLEIVT